MTRTLFSAITLPQSLRRVGKSGLLMGLLLSIVSLTPLIAQTIRYVKPVASGDGSGKNWDNASGDLQAMINASGVLQVWVAGGTYKPGGNANTVRTISFNLKNGVAVYGGFAGTEGNLSERPGVNPVSGQPNATRPSSSTLSGDIGQVGGQTDNSLAVVYNSHSDNTAQLDGFVITGGYTTGDDGGGMYNEYSSPQLRNLLVVTNVAESGGGMINRYTSNPTLTNCAFVSNAATSFGGGMYNVSSNPTLTNCAFVSNSVAYYGGGIANGGSSPSLINCAFLNNTASPSTGAGGGIFNSGSSHSLTNCTFLSNSAFRFGGGIVNDNSSIRLTNCVLFDNGGADTFHNTSNGSITATYCLFDASVTGYSSSPFNLTTTSSPFVSSTNLQLNACSPAINAGSNTTYTAANGPATDLAGNPRTFPTSGTIDMGAFEFQNTPDQPIALIQQPTSDSTVCAGATITASVSVTGSSPAFQWYKDNLTSPITGQTSATLTLPNLQTSNAGSYSAVVTGSCNSVTSAAFALSVNDPPSATLTNNGPLSCSLTSVTLTASGGDVYQFSPGATQSGTNGAQAIVNQAGVYSVTALSAGGCSAVASATVSSNSTIDPPRLQASASMTTNQPISVTANGCQGGTIIWNPQGGTGSASGDIYTFTQPGNYTLSASCTLGNCTSPASSPVSLTIQSGVFAITSVNTVACSPITSNRFSISFSPQYSGTTGQPVSFSVVNELLPTTEPGPFTLQLYTDNPVITLKATQTGSPVEASFAYNWLAACQTTQDPNTPPRLVTPLASQTATLGNYFSFVIPDSTFTDSETPLSLKLAAQGIPPGLAFSGATLSGTPSSTIGSPFSITLIATDPGGLTVSTPLTLSVLPASGPINLTTPFAITSVTTMSCTPVANKININFTPQYGGTNGQPISLEVLNEFGPTTTLGPYSLTLYRDNPVLTLRATQTGSAGQATYPYNWLEACQALNQDNTPPRVNSAVGNQTAVVGQAFSLNLANTFADQETPTSLTLSASGLPAGLSLVGTTLTGTPSVSGTWTVTLTATDPGSLSASTNFLLTVSPAGLVFSISGVQTLSCVIVSSGLRQVTFMPHYSGVNGDVISFSVVNEMVPTTSSGPYSLNLYTDNPVITLSARQGSSAASYGYSWLAACPSGARLGASEPGATLQVTVLGNPVSGPTVGVLIKGATGQPLRVKVVDLQGRCWHEQSVAQASEQEQLTVPVGPGGNLLLLQVSTPSAHQQIRLLRP